MLLPRHILCSYAALHYAARNGLNGILKQLLRGGADPDIKTAEGKTPLMLAEETKQENSAHILKHFIETGSVDGVVDVEMANASAEDADIMAELMELEVKPDSKFAPKVKEIQGPKSNKTSPAKSPAPSGGGGGGGGGGGAAGKPEPSGPDCGHDNAAHPEGFERVVTGGPSPDKMKLIEKKDPSAAAAAVAPPAAVYSVPDMSKKKSRAGGEPEDTVVYNESAPVEEPLYASVDIDKKVSMRGSTQPRAGTQSLYIPGPQSPSAAVGGTDVWLDDLPGSKKGSLPASTPAAAHVDLYDNAESAAGSTDLYDNSDAGQPLPAVPTQQRNTSEAIYEEVDDVRAPPAVPTTARPTSQVVAAPIVEPDYADADDVGAGAIAPIAVAPAADVADVGLSAFLARLSLPVDVVAALAENAGIDTPDDFMLFSEQELIKEHGFKVGHVRKILKALP